MTDDAATHSVRRHLRVTIDAYDATIRQFIPATRRCSASSRASWRRLPRAWCSTWEEGTGALAEAILESGAGGTVELIDVDREMLAQARTRLERFGGRVRFTEGSFLGALPRCNGAAASLALHHVPTLDAKRALYRRVHAALAPGGVFVNADATMPSDPAASEATWSAWADHMVRQGIARERAFKHFDEWAEEDTYFPLEEELATVAAAGFAAECVWREVGMTVVVGRKAG